MRAPSTGDPEEPDETAPEPVRGTARRSSAESAAAPRGGRPPLGPQTRPVLVLLALVQGIRAVALVVFSASVAALLTHIARAGYSVQAASGTASRSGLTAGMPDYLGGALVRADGLVPGTPAAGGLPAWLLWAGLAAALVRGLADWAVPVLARRAAARTKSVLRRRLVARLVSDGSPGTEGRGGSAVLASRSLDALDDYYTRTLTSLVATGAVPVVLLAAVFLADWVSGVVLVLTLPLVPVFMILIGRTTQEETAGAQAGLLRLSRHVVELARGLPVLVGLGRDRAQARALAEIGEDYRRRTMKTLRSAFLSSLALELVTTISVALVAVVIGVRLVQGSLGLDTGLFVLLLAPECFQPLRDVGTAYHQSQDGIQALRRTEEILKTPPGRSVRRTGADGRGALVRGLEAAFGGVTVLAGVDLDVPAGRTTVLTGPSGGGKSTLLGVLDGSVRDRPGTSGARVTGQVRVPSETARIGQDPRFLSETALSEVLFAADRVAPQRWLDRRAGDDADGTSNGPAADSPEDHDVLARARRALHEVGLSDREDVHPSALSAGQARRLAVARVLARISEDTAPDALVLVDEPTAHLDRRAGEAVEAALRRLAASGAALLVVTHDERLAAGADARVHLENGILSRCPEAGTAGAARAAAVSAGAPGKAPVHPEPGLTAPGARERTTARTGPEEAAGSEAVRIPDGVRGPTGSESGSPGAVRIWQALRRSTGLTGWRGAASLALSVLTLACGAALTALSGWLVGRAGQQPGMMYLFVAVTGVRFFGLGRAVFRYAERLVTHDAVLRASDALRIRTWRTLGRTALGVRSLMRGDAFLGRLVGTVDDLRDALPRVLLPMAAYWPITAGAVLTAWLTVPGTTWPVLVAALLGGAVLPLVVLAADGAAERRIRESSARTLALTSAGLEAAEDLRANGLGSGLLAVLDRIAGRSERAERRAAWATGLGSGAVVLLWWSTALVVLALAAGPVQSGAVSAPVAAIPVLLCTAMVESSAQAVEAWRGWPGLARLIAEADRNAGGRHQETEQRTDRESEQEPEDGTKEPEASADETPHPRTPVRRIRLEEVAARWPGMDRPALTGLTGGVVPGRWWAVTGPSGSGKSTALAVLLGFLPVERGRILADGRSVGPTDLRGASAWCPQNAYVFDSTLRGNLCLARPRNQAPTKQEMLRVLGTVGLEEWFAGLPEGWETRLGPGGARISGGQRQRLSVARALLTDSRILLMDEPTAHLDEPTARAMMVRLRQGLRTEPEDEQSAAGVVIISHRPEDLAECDTEVSLS